MGKCRDNDTNLDVGASWREGCAALTQALPQVVLDYQTSLAAPGASEDDKWNALWDLLKKHRGEAVFGIAFYLLSRSCSCRQRQRHTETTKDKRLGGKRER